MLRIVLLLAAAIPLVSSSSARAVITLSVSNLKDSGPGSLRQAIADAAAGDTITFRVTGTITLTSGALVISQDLQINGPGPNKLKISGHHASRVFVVQGGTVTLAGITVTRGLADVNSPILASIGGGVLNYGSLTLSHVVVSDNAAIGDANASPFGLTGWAIAGGVASFGTLVVNDSQFTGNLARAGDGSIGGDVGLAVAGAFGNWGPATINDSVFIGNVARGGDGGSGSIEVGLGLGGAIGNAGALTVSGSMFSHNQALGGSDNTGNPGGAGGGAIGSGGGTGPVSLIVSNTRFDHNMAIGGKGYSGNGGGINVWRGDATINDCTLEHNEALGGTGGLGVYGGSGFGGGIAAGNVGGGSNVTVRNSTVEHNSARGGSGVAGGSGGNGMGGGLRVFPGATLTLEGTTVSYNLALAGAPGGQGIGGGVYHDGSFSFDRTTVIAKNHASTSGDNIAP
jgi:hypothetical protein